MAGPYFVDVTTGNDGDDGLSEGNAFQTLSHAADTIAAGEKCWVKASASYVVEDGSTDCVMYLDTPGGVTTGIVWEGYSSSTGDGGVVTIDADTNTLASAVEIATGTWAYNHFKNFRFTGGSGAGVECNGPDGIKFENCRFDNNDGNGFGGTNSNNNNFYNCLFDNNGNYGVSSVLTQTANCVFHGNTSMGVSMGNGVVVNSLFYENGNGSGDYAIYTGSGQYGSVAVVGCTIDGDDTTNNNVDGIRFASSSQTSMVLNCVIFDCQQGIEAGSDCGEGVVADANLYYSNDADRSNFLSGANDVSGSGDPFTDEPNDDYSLKDSSEGEDAGRDSGDTVSDWGL